MYYFIKNTKVTVDTFKCSVNCTFTINYLMNAITMQGRVNNTQNYHMMLVKNY